jgi:hypothetical protein
MSAEVTPDTQQFFTQRAQTSQPELSFRPAGSHVRFDAMSRLRRSIKAIKAASIQSRCALTRFIISALRFRVFGYGHKKGGSLDSFICHQDKSAPFFVL